MTHESNIEKQLVDAGYAGLFLYGEGSLCDGIWQNGQRREELENLIFSNDTSANAKFLAAELLRRYDVRLQPAAIHILSAVYADALKNSSEQSGNASRLSGNEWGFLYPLNDAGHLGSRVIELGDAAIPYLKKLLNDDGIILYEGSQEATMGNRYQYRVKDFAAYYISKIKNIPVQFYQDTQQRDEEIERLKNIFNQ